MQSKVKTLDELAAAVLAGELKSCPWLALRTLFFKGLNDKHSMDLLVGWARKHDITVSVQPRRMSAPGVATVAWDVHFSGPLISQEPIKGNGRNL
jgi:hypothetical protein